MSNFILEVRAVRRCTGGHTCNLIANGKKVAFIGPGIFEWCNHSKMVEILEWFSKTKKAVSISKVPTELEEGWESKIPDHKQNDKENAAQAKLLLLVKCYIEAYEVKKRGKEELFGVNIEGKIVSDGYSPSLLKDNRLAPLLRSTYWKILNEMSYEQVAELLIELRGLA